MLLFLLILFASLIFIGSRSRHDRISLMISSPSPAMENKKLIDDLEERVKKIESGSENVKLSHPPLPSGSARQVQTESISNNRSVLFPVDTISLPKMTMSSGINLSEFNAGAVSMHPYALINTVDVGGVGEIRS